jgi:putative redox protein
VPDTRACRLEWSGEGLRFNGKVDKPDAPSFTIDGNGKVAPGPMSALLLSCASCSAVDVVEMLAKMRVDLRSLVVEVTGVRRDEMPRRYIAINYRFRLSGHGLEQHHAERAVSLSIEKYCSAIASLASDIKLTHEIVIE